MAKAAKAVEHEPLAMVNPTELVPWELNPRDNSGAIDAVADSIKRFGFASPIVARVGDRRVVAGHTRLAAALLLGLASVPVRWMDLTDDQAAALALADNKLGEAARWDDEALAAILTELDQHEFEVEGLGFTDDEVDALLRGFDSADPLPAERKKKKPPKEANKKADGDTKGLKQRAHVKIVQVFLSGDLIAEYNVLARAVSEHLGTQNLTDTVLGAFRAYAEAHDLEVAEGG